MSKKKKKNATQHLKNNCIIYITEIIFDFFLLKIFINPVRLLESINKK